MRRSLIVKIVYISRYNVNLDLFVSIYSQSMILSKSSKNFFLDPFCSCIVFSRRNLVKDSIFMSLDLNKCKKWPNFRLDCPITSKFCLDDPFQFSKTYYKYLLPLRNDDTDVFLRFQNDDTEPHWFLENSDNNDNESPLHLKTTIPNIFYVRIQKYQKHKPNVSKFSSL